MNDQELMESAAMAIGRLKPHGNANLTRPNEELHHSNGVYWFWPAGESWNPLKDDGDRYRLAKKLGILIDFEECFVRYPLDSGSHVIRWPEEAKNDAYAVVQAAAEIWKAQEPKP